MARKKINKDKKDFLEMIKNLVKDTKNSENSIEDIMKKIIEAGIQQIMEIERDEYVGAGSYERSDNRKTYRNG